MVESPALADRVGAACGAAYVLLILVGSELSTSNSQAPHPTGATDLADFTAVPTGVENTGFIMEVAGFLAFMFFLGWLVHALRRQGGPSPWLAGVAGLGGVITLAVKLSSVMPIMAGKLDHQELTPAMARVLTDMNGAAFVVTFLPFGVFVAATGMAFLATGFLGRLAGWCGVVIGALTVLAPLVTRLDPIDTNVLPFLAALIWLLVISVRLAWKGGRVTEVEMTERALTSMA